MSIMKISVIGLGKLGACTAACFASKGYEVLGVDVNQETVDNINQGKAPVVEPGLQEVLDQAGDRFRATLNYEEALQQSNISFLITPTPSAPGGHFSDKYLKAALKPLARSLKKSGKDYHTFVITSTVSPGTTNESLIPYIERYSDRNLNQGFGVSYNPEFIALGSVINDFLNPDLVLIGESDTFVGSQVEDIYKRVCENKPYIARMSIPNAEITKLSLNAYVTMKISFANTLANLCERVPDSNVDAITQALGADRRIGPHYLKGGPPYGGPCFPRDNRAFMAFAKKYGAQAELAKATDRVNHKHLHHLTDLVLENLPNSDEQEVSIFGLSYKPDTPVIEESPSIRLIRKLLEKGVNITVYDPLAMENTRKLFGDEISYAKSVKDCASSSPYWIITTTSQEFKNLDDSYINETPTTIIDCWRIIDPTKFSKKIRYVGLGRSLSQENS